MKTRADIRLLLIEDSDDHAELILSMLSRHTSTRYQIERVRTAGEGIATVEGQEFDIILTDLSLPDSEPQDTLRTIIRHCPETPVVILTSLAEDELVQMGLELGAQDFLDKSSIRKDAVERCIRYAIERKEVLLELERRNNQLERFAHNVAHELRTPLQGIMMAFDLFGELPPEKRAGERFDDFTKLGRESSEDMNRIIDGLLAFAKSSSEEIAREDVDLDAATRDLIGVVARGNKIGEDHFEVPDKLPTVKGSEVHLRQVVRNLLDNAVKYSGDKPVKITVTSESGSGLVTFRVRDKGLGIEPDDVKRVFDVLYRAQSANGIRGHGIGLGFCKSVIERHGGRIGVTSTPGEGSVFEFSLPTDAKDL